MTSPDIQIVNDLIELKHRFNHELDGSKAKYKDDKWWYWFKRYNSERFQLLVENGRV